MYEDFALQINRYQNHSNIDIEQMNLKRMSKENAQSYLSSLISWLPDAENLVMSDLKYDKESVSWTGKWARRNDKQDPIKLSITIFDDNKQVVDYHYLGAN